MSKQAIILLNLGSPDAPESIAPFLRNFFMDKNIIRAPYLVRFMLSRWIAFKRGRGEAGTAYGLLGGKSPLLKNTQKQADVLQERLGDNARVFIAMRYWHPMADAVVRTVRDYDPDEIILLPLYPQYSTTTTRSSFEDWDRAAQKIGFNKPTRKIGCYPLNQGFIKASADNIKSVIKQAKKDHPDKDFRILFSAHGLPEKIIKDGDPYQYQCEEAARVVAENIGATDWQICYQSRVGPLKWIGPSTEQALEQAASDNKAVIIYPHAFVSEHVETLVEIDIEYRELAEKLGVPAFYKVDTVGTHPDFINGLVDVLNGKRNFACPENYRHCACRDTCA